MKLVSLSRVTTGVISLFLSIVTYGQNFGTNASAAWITDCTQSNYYNTSGAGPALIGPAGNVFNNASFGAHTQNSGTLILRGGQVKTFKTPAVANVCSARINYRVYLQSGTPGTFTAIDLPLLDDCNISTGQFPSGGACAAGDQKWDRVIASGQTIPYAPVDLTAYAPGNYVLEVYFEVTGSSSSTTLCNETVTLNNGGANYKASFSIQAPVLNSTNTSTCNASDGSITIGGLVAGLTYAVSYTDDGMPIGPLNYVPNSAGEITITGLNAGIYADFELLVNGCTTQLNTGLIISNPVITPTFAAIPPFCAGSTPPVLPGTSLNGISGTWSPATVSNTASGSYTFTPSPGLCAIPAVRFITVKPNVTPSFSFGTSSTICSGGSVPSLPTTSTNSINGTWSPATVSNTASAVYTFTPAAGQCATTATFSVTINPNISPTFSFGTSLTICAGAGTPTLVTTSTNGISGSWSPATVDNQNSGVYTFTPSAGQCATTGTFTVTVNPNAIPTFSFGTALTICAGGTVPSLPGVSTNSINGTWSPAVVDNQNSGTYTFTPTGGICALPATFTVTVNPNVTPTFSFGTSLTICNGGTVPALVTNSTNGISGTWSAATVSNTASAVYTFTPTAGQCATTTTFTVTVNPVIAPSFGFGSSLTICAGGSVPSLPAMSSNGIAGTWSPATVDNQNSAIYTFTPNPGECATTTTFTVTVNPNVTPTFSFGTALTICAGGAVPALPSTSTNGIAGTWSPATVDNQNSATYTFTPSGGQCAVAATFTVSVIPNITPAFSFGTSLNICAGGSVPALATTSTNGISGTWSPGVVDNQNSGTYTFTPGSGQCALTATFTVTVNPIVTPAFSFGTTLAICAGAQVPSLPTNSTNGIAGTWSPATVDNQNSGVYTFTPAAGQCASTATFNVSVNSNTTPTFSFGTTSSICSGAGVPSLPATSSNSITGVWSPASVNNQSSGTYTFTPNGGQCAASTTFTVTVIPTLTPAFSFGTSLTVCAGSSVPSLPSTSTNGVAGTWNPATVDNQNSGVYSFTPSTGQCAVPVTFTVTVNPNVAPAFSFGAALTICSGSTPPALPQTSANGIAGTWAPSTIDNQNSAVYTFTPAAGQCATSGATLTVTINPTVTPSFAIGSTLTICAGSAVPSLPTTSTNGVTGTWNPAVVDDDDSGIYTFTPSAGQCATPTTYTVTVNQKITPAFSFGTSVNICAGNIVPTLQTTSNNGISGSWSPAVVDNQNSGTYTFTPDAGQCANAVTLTVSVNPVITPTFSFGTTLTICAGSAVPSLAALSGNNISGTWSPAVVDNQNSATYTFTPAGGQCANTTTFTVTVNANTVPAFNFGTALTICAGGSVPVLTTTSDNMITGTWSPTVVDNQTSGVYAFTPAAMPGQCIAPATFVVTVNPVVTPTFNFGTSMTLCAGANVPALPPISTNGISGTWLPSTIDNQNSATYTFTTAAGQCAAATATLAVTVNPLPTIQAGSDTTVMDGAFILENVLSGAGMSYTWTNSNPSIGLSASGTGSIPSFTATNNGNNPAVATITVTPVRNGCTGPASSYVITVMPLAKDVFVPNVFTPNSDGKNDVLFVYSNDISKLEMRIFNQWGEQIELITDKNKGWDGKHKGKAQPVGVYVYTLKAVMTDGRIVNLRGNITLLR